MSNVKTGFVSVSPEVILYYEDTGEGTPIVFVHEFGGDYRSWGTRHVIFPDLPG
mgnify:FL=1